MRPWQTERDRQPVPALRPGPRACPDPVQPPVPAVSAQARLSVPDVPTAAVGGERKRRDCRAWQCRLPPVLRVNAAITTHLSTMRNGAGRLRNVAPGRGPARRLQAGTNTSSTAIPSP